MVSLDVLEAIRKRVGDTFIVGFRYTADEAQKGGISTRDSQHRKSSQRAIPYRNRTANLNGVVSINR